MLSKITEAIEVARRWAADPPHGYDQKMEDEMKVFVSQPMAGLSRKEILDNREKVAARVLLMHPEAEIIDSYFSDYRVSTGNVSLKYLAKSIELLADADMAVFCDGWQNARGCRIEHECAVAYGIPAVDEMLTAEGE